MLPAGVGVNIHFVTGQEQDLDLIQQAGFKFIRMDFDWSSIETKKGEYSWKVYDELLAHLEQRGLRAIFILDYSHPLYEETVTSPHPQSGVAYQTTASPRHPESIAAFARFAAAAAKHFHARHILWEIWNEPNGNFWSPKPNAPEYTALAVATARAIRQAEPKATIIGPAAAAFPWEFLETFLKSGVLEDLDAVSVHPYRDGKSPPETAAPDYERLKGLINQYAPAAKKGKIPILSGEWGYSTWNKGVSLETQANFAVRQQLANLLNGIPLSIWYDWRNDGPDANENEHNFGTVQLDLKPKPAYLAIQTLTRELSGCHIERRLRLGSEQDYLLLCVNRDRQQKLAAWTLGDAHTITLEVQLKGKDKPAGTARNGETFAPKIEAGRLTLELTGSPQYITLGEAGLKAP